MMKYSTLPYLLFPLHCQFIIGLPLLIILAIWLLAGLLQWSDLPVLDLQLPLKSRNPLQHGVLGAIMAVSAVHAMEREFCQLSGFVWVKKLRLLIKYTDWFKQDLGELVYADLNSNFKFRSWLRPIWPLKSHIISFLLRYHIALAFRYLRL